MEKETNESYKNRLCWCAEDFPDPAYVSLHCEVKTALFAQFVKSVEPNSFLYSPHGAPILVTDDKQITRDTSAFSTNDQREPLSGKVMRASAWVFGLRAVDRGLGFVRTIILAKLLVPEDFGLLGIAMLSLSALETFSQTGFHASLIHRKKDVDAYLDTTWTVGAIRGIILFTLIFLSAPWIAGFFNSPHASLVIKVIAVSTLLSGFSNVGIVFFQKDMEFNKQFAYSLSATLTDMLFSVVLAVVLKNVWALVLGGLAGNVVRLMMSFVLHPYRPRITIAREEFHELFRFGRWVLGSSMLVFLVTQGDDIFVGKMLGAASLGLYQMAYLLSNLPATEISHVLSQVMFPAYSKLQHDIHRLREAYLHVLQLTVFAAAPMACGMFVLAGEFVWLFLGEKWMVMVPAIQVLAFAGLIRAVAATTGPVFYGVGKPKLDTIWQAIRLLVLATAIYPLTVRWDLTGASLAVLLSILIASCGFSYHVVRIVRCGIRPFIKVIALPVLSSIIMIMIVSAAKEWFLVIGFPQFFLLVGLGVFSYGVITYLFDRFLNYGITILIREKVGFQPSS